MRRGVCAQEECVFVRQAVRVASVLAVAAAASAAAIPTNTRLDGYRGIWFSIGQENEYGPKYSGGLGTYTANHVPMAIYAPEVNRTFFTYGGVDSASGDLLIMVSYYDHTTCQVPRPTVVYHKVGVNDPHDNAALLIDREGYLWVFISGRASSRPGFIYRSTAPYSIDQWEHRLTDERTYPQPWYIEEGVERPLFLHMFTKYTAGRELYWATSPDGVNWSEHRKLAGFGGHYQTSCEYRGKIGTAFNYHPNGVDTRTNLYYLQTTDAGQTWTTADGTPVTVPLSHKDNPALVADYQSQGLLVYINDTNFDADGRPHIVYITSRNYAAGPGGDPRVWHLARWTGQQWVFSDITTSDHNYDVGSLWIEGPTLRILGPTEPGPQVYGTGGEVALWTSQDGGDTWGKTRDVTQHSRYNHSYIRRVRNGCDPFYAFWADGDPLRKSESRLYFCNRAGTHVWRLPTTLSGEFAWPERVLDFDGSDVIEPLWRSSFETLGAAMVAHGQAAVAIANTTGEPGMPVGSLPLEYARYGESGVGAAPSAGAGTFALRLPDSRTNAIDTGIRSDAGGLSQSLTFEGYFRTPESAPITSPTSVGRRLVTQKQATDETSRLAIGLHANGSRNVLAVFYRDSAGAGFTRLGTTAVQPDTWYHFALVYDGVAIRWYLNGHLEGQQTGVDLAPAGAGIITVANLRRNGSSDRGFYGYLDEVRLVDQPLTPDAFLLNGGSCGALCGSAGGHVLWCSGFEYEPQGNVAHGQADVGVCGAVKNTYGMGGTGAGAMPPTYAAYGQPGVGAAPSTEAGAFAMYWPADRTGAINTYIASDAGGLAAALTFEGFFNTLEVDPITSPAYVGRRLVTQKRSSNAGESRLAIGLHANGAANVLAVYWRSADGSGADHLALGTTPISPNAWHHFALVYDGLRLCWYLDGRPEGQVDAPGIVPPGSAPITIGNRTTEGIPDRGFWGFLDEIRIVDRALGPDQFLNFGPRPEDGCPPDCAEPFADADGDGDVDVSDFAVFQGCFNGAGRPWSPPPADPHACGCLDQDDDGDVDVADFAAFQACFNGAARPPACNP